MKATFTYYKREYELEFDEESRTGTITWLDGMYHSWLGFYEMNGHVMFKARGKLANSSSKKMSKKKKDALKAKIKEIVF